MKLYVIQKKIKFDYSSRKLQITIHNVLNIIEGISKGLIMINYLWWNLIKQVLNTKENCKVSLN